MLMEILIWAFIYLRIGSTFRMLAEDIDDEVFENPKWLIYLWPIIVIIELIVSIRYAFHFWALDFRLWRKNRWK